MTQIKQEYHGHNIFFDEDSELWSVLIGRKRSEHTSIKIVKAFIDRSNKADFKRVEVYREKGGYYDTDKGYEKVTITSIGIDEDIFYVKEGQKHAHRGSRNEFYVVNKKNELLIKEIAETVAELKRLKNLKQKQEEQLEEFDIEALIKKALKTK